MSDYRERRTRYNDELAKSLKPGDLVAVRHYDWRAHKSNIVVHKVLYVDGIYVSFGSGPQRLEEELGGAIETIWFRPTPKDIAELEQKRREHVISALQSEIETASIERLEAALAALKSVPRP